MSAEVREAVRGAGGHGFEGVWCRLLRARGEEVAAVESGDVRECYGGESEKVARRLATRGCWDERVEDGVPTEIQPLHMSAVREALGALIPERLQRSMGMALKGPRISAAWLRVSATVHGPPAPSLASSWRCAAPKFACAAPPTTL